MGWQTAMKARVAFQLEITAMEEYDSL